MSIFLILMARYRRQQRPQVRIYLKGAGIDLWWGFTAERRFSA